MPMNNAQKVKLGQRWVCYECAARFYDLNRPEPLCPKCQADQRQSPAFAGGCGGHGSVGPGSR